MLINGLLRTLGEENSWSPLRRAKTVKEMAEGWKKKTRDEPVSDDHAEGEEEEPKEDDATVADDQHRSYPKAGK